ncbi:MAG TPA: metal-dependent hydrolase [Vicinamibacterales bacterium]|nr:metal-dependent hydrolase [Vicinamibacterales bacterium]
MDNVTHTLFALTLARTPLGRAGRGTTAALVVASNAPDMDIVATVGGAAKYLQWHRGPTHGPLGVVALGFLTALGVWLVNRRSSEPAASFGMLFGLSALGVLLHDVLDLMTSYGTRIMSPFSWTWVTFDWMPIIDIYLIALLTAGLFFGWRSAEASRRNAALALMLMAGDYGLRAAAHHEALVLGSRVPGAQSGSGTTALDMCDPGHQASELIFWPPRTDTIEPKADAVDPSSRRPVDRSSSGRCVMGVAALPSLVSPFRWRIVVQRPNAYDVHDVDVIDSRFGQEHLASSVRSSSVIALRYPNVWTPVVERAATTRVGQIFLGFSRFPMARTTVDSTGTTTVRLDDARFVGGMVSLERSGRGPLPFEASVRIARNGVILDETLAR